MSSIYRSLVWGGIIFISFFFLINLARGVRHPPIIYCTSRMFTAPSQDLLQPPKVYCSLPKVYCTKDFFHYLNNHIFYPWRWKILKWLRNILHNKENKLICWCEEEGLSVGLRMINVKPRFPPPVFAGRKWFFEVYTILKTP